MCTNENSVKSNFIFSSYVEFSIQKTKEYGYQSRCKF